MNFLGFDIEISNVFDLKPDEDLENYAPFDISVCATQLAGGEHRLWHSIDSAGKPALNFTRQDALELLGYLEQRQKEGAAIVAWNGLSFDMKWLGHVAGDFPRAAAVARKMVDPMFQFFKIKGFPIGLAAVAKGMRLPCTKLMQGCDAPICWRDGKHDLVCEYVMSDARITIEIASAIASRKQIAWVTQKGTTSTIPLPRLRTVEDCLRDPMPDQSWMRAPIPQKKFAGWLG
jgi:hypothetical protein